MYSTFSLWESVAKFQCLLKVVCRFVKLFQFHLYPFKDRQYKFMRLMHLCSWRNLVMRKSSFASKGAIHKLSRLSRGEGVKNCRFDKVKRRLRGGRESKIANFETTLFMDGPKEGVRTARVAPPISKNFKVFSDPTLNRGLLWLSKQTNPLINQFLHICDFLHHHDLLLQGAYSIVYKVLYIKYSKHWPPYLLASTMDCGCSKILNHWLFLSLFKFFGWKYILNWI